MTGAIFEFIAAISHSIITVLRKDQIQSMDGLATPQRSFHLHAK